MTQPGMFGLSVSGVNVGRGNGSSVSSSYHGAEKEVLAYLARD
jgi:hypothetical protein